MDIITSDLNVSQKALEIASKIIDCDDSKKFRAGIEKIAQGIIDNYDDSVFAARLLLRTTIKTVPSLNVYLLLNKNALKTDIYEYMENNMDWLQELLDKNDHWNYYNQDFFSADTLFKTYLRRAIYKEDPTETPNLMKLRIAVQMYYHDKNHKEEIPRCFLEFCMGYLTPATPTCLMAGTKKNQMSSCFLMSVNDNLPSMCKGIDDSAIISSNVGGIGYNAGAIRHSDIADSGISAGVMPYLRVLDKNIGYVDQSRKRRGAATVFIPCWHKDILEFIESASNFINHDLKLSDAHTCVWACDLFYERAAKNENWTIFCPNTVPGLLDAWGDDFEELYVKYEKLVHSRNADFENAEKEYKSAKKNLCENPTKENEIAFSLANDNLEASRKNRIFYETIKARDILDAMVKIRIQSGKPYSMNGDKCNAKSNQQNIGTIKSSNLCVEIVQYSDADNYSSCNLTSLNLSAFSKNKFNHSLDDSSDEEILNELKRCYDFQLLGNTSRSAVKNTNKVIDENYYILGDKIKGINARTRPLGIGASGLDDAFKMCDLEYGSKASILLNKMIFACMYYYCLLESNNISIAEGEYPDFRKGTHKIYNPITKKMETFEGSPLSNGHFQFDLWNFEYLHDRDLGRINSSLYDPEDNKPIDPKYFDVDGTWEELRELIVNHGVRNSLLMAMMPTASTAHIIRNAESVEAHQSNMYTRETSRGGYTMVNRHLHKDLEDAGINVPEVRNYIYNNNGSLTGLSNFVRKNVNMFADFNRINFLEKKYKTMFDIRPSLFLKMARQRGIYVDQSQSTNIYIEHPTIEKLMLVENIAYHLKLKTHIYYLRMGADSSNTGFNKTVENVVIKDDGSFPAVKSENQEELARICRIDNPEGCTMCN